MDSAFIAMHARVSGPQVELVHVRGVWQCGWGNLNAHAYGMATPYLPWQ